MRTSADATGGELNSCRAADRESFPLPLSATPVPTSNAVNKTKQQARFIDRIPPFKGYQ
jgi:hypothetical protein